MRMMTQVSTRTGYPEAPYGYREGMAHLDIDTVLGWRGRTVRDAEGDKIGPVGDVFLDRETDRPAWIGVRTGLFGRHESYVPLEQVTEDEDGDLRVPYDAQLVKDAPRIDPDVALTGGEEHALYRHYDQQYEAPAEGAAAGHGDTDEAMTRSEEEVVVREGAPKPTEKVRLRKVLVTEEERRVVPVRREVIQLESEPPPEGHVESVEDVDDPSSRPPDRA
jgi:hypothetical protein